MDINNLLLLGDVVKLRNGSYKILNLLGNGKCGMTYLVICIEGENIGCYFALKIFYRLDLENRKQRFLNEINLLKGLHHPSIIQYYDDGEHLIAGNLHPVLIMNYIPVTLDQELQKGPLKMIKALMYTTQLLSAVKYLQDKNILHRDIKPTNIFVNTNQLILGDLGLFKNLNDYSVNDDINYIEENFFKNNISNGTMPRFFRTPQLVKYINKQEYLNLKSDIFQLGLVLSILFTGKNPLKPAQNISDPIELEKLEPIPGKYGAEIEGLINRMVNTDETMILEIDELCKRFYNIFLRFVIDMHGLEGNIFGL